MVSITVETPQITLLINALNTISLLVDFVKTQSKVCSFNDRLGCINLKRQKLMTIF